jgi:hypothetical protein
MQHQEIIFGSQRQAFMYDPPDGRPDSSPIPTVHVLAGDRTVAATTGMCTIDPVATVLVGDVYRGAKSIRVASVDGIVPGGRYLMTKPEGDREWLEAIAIRDTTLVIKHPVIHRYAGAATIVGCRISIDIDPAWCADRANLCDAFGWRCGLARYSLRWTYTRDGIERTGVSFADLVRTRVGQLVSPQDVDARFPGWIAGLPPEHRDKQGADFIAEAFRAVRLEALGNHHAQCKISDTKILRELVNARAHVIRLEHDVMYGRRHSTELEIAEKRYRTHYARLVEIPKLVAPAPQPSLPSPAKHKLRASQPGVSRRVPKLTKQ